MRTTLHQSYLSKFSPIASYDVLYELYLNDPELRDKIAAGKLAQIKDGEIRKKIKKMAPTIAVSRRNDLNIYPMGQLREKKPTKNCSKIWSKMMTNTRTEDDEDITTTNSEYSDFDDDDDDTTNTASTDSSDYSSRRINIDDDYDVDSNTSKYSCRNRRRRRRPSYTRGSPSSRSTEKRGNRSNMRYSKKRNILANKRDQSASNVNPEKISRIMKNVLKTERKKDNLRLLLSQLVGIDRSSAKSVPSNLSNIQRVLADIQARVTTLSEREQRVNVESIYMTQVPGTSAEILPRTSNAINCRIEPLLNAKIAYEDGEVCKLMRELQKLAAEFWSEYSRLNVANASSRSSGSEIRVDCGFVTRTPWTQEHNSASSAAAANVLREKTLSLFIAALLEADKWLAGGAIKAKRFILSRSFSQRIASSPSSSSSSPSQIDNTSGIDATTRCVIPCSSDQTVRLEATEITIDDNADWNFLQDNHVEIASVSFERKPHYQQTAENVGDGSRETYGLLRIRFNGPQFFAMSADPWWKPQTASEFDNAELGQSASANYTQLANRHVFILKRIAHMMVHIVASLHNNLDGPCYNHPNTFEFKEIQRYFEPFSVV